MTNFTLTPQFQLQREASGQLHFVDAHGQTHVGAVPVRAFPLAAPLQGVSLIGENGKEVLWIAELDAVDAAARRLLDEDLGLEEVALVLWQVAQLLRGQLHLFVF